MGTSNAALTDAELLHLLPKGPDVRLYVLLTKGDALVCTAAPDGTPGDAIGQGDAGSQTQAALRALAKKKRLFVAEVDADSVDGAALMPPGRLVTVAELRRLAKDAEDAAGRLGDIDAKTAEVVRRRAAWRCQFDGCGIDLSEHAPTGKAGNFAYLAHIVAASPKGPRGHPTESARLANDPDNILLLCDSCHRVIDRVDPGKFTVAYLQEMRERSIARVKTLLDSLTFPEYHILAVTGTIAGQMAVFNRREAYEAMRQRGMRPEGEPHTFLQGAADQPDNTTPAHWQAQAGSIQQEISGLQAWLNGASRGGHATERLAVFPIHNMSKLILAGRIVGEARTVRLFQFRRDVASGDVLQWSWPANATAPEPNKFQLHAPAPNAEGAEGVLLYCLTATVSQNALPAEVRTLPTWTITAATPHREVINHPECLDAVATHIESVLVDAERRGVRKLHVFPISPASACFRLGQKLQARHHATVAVYERPPARRGEDPQPFYRTIEILPSTVNFGGGVSIRI